MKTAFSLILPACLLVAAAAWAGLEARGGCAVHECLERWDDGTPVWVSPGALREECRAFRRSACRVAGERRELPGRWVLGDGTLAGLLELVHGAGAEQERCGGLLSVRVSEAPDAARLLSERLERASVLVRRPNGSTRPCRLDGGRFQCGDGHDWNWVGQDRVAGAPVVRAHLLPGGESEVLRFARPAGYARLALRVGFSPEAATGRSPWLGFGFLRAESGGRHLGTRAFFPALGPAGLELDLSWVAPGATFDLILEGLGSWHGEVVLAGRWEP
jgi:hypothetical protein